MMDVLPVDVTNKREDSRIAWCLWVAAVLCVPLSSPMFLVHFHAAAAKPNAPVGVLGLFVLELVKVALFSALAVWAGKHAARGAGIDAPVMRALVRGDKVGAVGSVKRAMPTGLVLGIAALTVWVVVRSLIEEKSVGALLASAADGQTPFTSASGVFYDFAGNLWFRWGILSLASRAVSAMTGFSSERAFPWANALAALAFGLYACIGVYGPHHGEPGANRFLVEAILGYGLPSLIYGLAVRRLGLVSAVIAMSTSRLGDALLGAVLGVFA